MSVEQNVVVLKTMIDNYFFAHIVRLLAKDKIEIEIIALFAVYGYYDETTTIYAYRKTHQTKSQGAAQDQCLAGRTSLLQPYQCL